MSFRLMPLTSASAMNPPTSASVTRLEMVMVKRSLEAANAIKAGNTRRRIASVSMAIPLQRTWILGPARCSFVIARPKMPITSAVAAAATEVNLDGVPIEARHRG